MCRQEIRWAEQYKKPIVALVRINDKAQIGKFIAEGKCAYLVAPSLPLHVHTAWRWWVGSFIIERPVFDESALTVERLEF